jgi:hypothetical protein
MLRNLKEGPYLVLDSVPIDTESCRICTFHLRKIADQNLAATFLHVIDPFFFNDIDNVGEVWLVDQQVISPG